MKTYFVTWSIDIEAESPREAAQQALEIQRDHNSFATVFEVYDENGEPQQIDLMEGA